MDSINATCCDQREHFIVMGATGLSPAAKTTEFPWNECHRLSEIGLGRLPGADDAMNSARKAGRIRG